MTKEGQISRRKFVSTAAAAGIIGLAAGGAGGYLAAPRAVVEVPTGAVVTETKTVTAAAGPKKPIKIGSSFPLTGWGASYGELMKNGAELAVEEINNAGGILGRPVELTILDAEDMVPEKVIRNFERLGAMGVNALIMGFHSGVGGGVDYETAAKLGIIYLHENTFHLSEKWQLDNPGKYWMVFQTDPVETYYAIGFYTFIKSIIDRGLWKPPNKKFAVINSDNPYGIWIGENFRDLLIKDGWELSLYDQAVVPTVEWGPFLSKVRANPPAILLQTDYATDDAGTFTTQFVANPTNTLLLLQAAPSIPEFFDIVGEKADGALWNIIQGLLPDEIGNAYSARYRKKYGKDPSWFQDVMVYDEFYLYKHAVSLAGDPDDQKGIARELRNIIFRGVQGSIRFKPDVQTAYSYPSDVQDASLGTPFMSYQVRGKTNVLVDPKPWAKEDFKLPPWIK
jgi:branched-chain amino acid transport system substrate-binding protein